MSGGYFDYQQYMLGRIAADIEHIIETNESEEIGEWGDKKGRFYAPETIRRFEEAVNLIRTAEIYAQRIDWLLSGDDGEESFLRRLSQELAEHAKR